MSPNPHLRRTFRQIRLSVPAVGLLIGAEAQWAIVAHPLPIGAAVVGWTLEGPAQDLVLIVSHPDYAEVPEGQPIPELAAVQIRLEPVLDRLEDDGGRPRP